MWHLLKLSKDKLMKLQNTVFNIIILLSYLLYIIVLFGVSYEAPKYLNTLDYYVSVYVSFFLIVRFNPFRKIEFNDLDRKIAFSAGTLLFTSVVMNSILTKMGIKGLNQN